MSGITQLIIFLFALDKPPTFKKMLPRLDTFKKSTVKNATIFLGNEKISKLNFRAATITFALRLSKI